MIRVLHFASVINRYDFIDTVLTNLDRSRFEPGALTVVPPKNRKGNYSDAEKYETKCLDTEFKRSNYPQIFSALKEEIKRFQPHILQTHHYEESIMGAILSKTMNIPAFVIGHHYSDLIYVLSKGLRRRMHLAIEKFCNNAADRIVVPTQEVVDVLLRQKVEPEKIAKIPYGTDFGMFSNVSAEEVIKIREQYDLKDKFVALTCCRLNKEKGLDHLLAAVPQIKARFPFFQLVMVGDGPYGEKLRELCKELCIEDAVQFIGWRSDALNWYSVSDVVVQPSLSESFCQVLTESLALDKPVVMTPVGIAPEIIINDERGGCLVPIGDSKAISDALCSLIENPQHRSKLAENGRQYIKENMTIELTARKYENLYEELIKEKKISV